MISPLPVFLVLGFCAVSVYAELTPEELEKCKTQALVSDNYKPLDAKGYKDVNGGPVESPEKLDFDSAKAQDGCWKNYRDPVDANDFIVYNDVGLIKEHCGDPVVGTLPSSGTVLAHVSTEKREGTVELHSCAILCSKKSPNVTLDAAMSGDVTVEVCLADAFTEPVTSIDAQDCQPIEKDDFNKPIAIGEIEKPAIYDVVIRTQNYRAGDYFVFKTIKVEYEPCPSDACNAACDFTKDSCAYKKDDSASKGNAEFKNYVAKTIVGNLDTGVNALGDGNENAGEPEVLDGAFYAAPLNPGDVAVSTVELGGKEGLGEEVNIAFKFYDSTDGVSAKVCVDDKLTDCTDLFESDKGVVKEDRKWREKTVKIPAKTKKLHLVGDNGKGTKFGSTGFSAIKVVDDSGKDVGC